MKKLMYIAAALLVLVGCNKNDNIVENAPEGTPFEKGQKVTLTVGTGAQQGPNRVAGVDNTAQNQIDFTWEEGDQILVKVDDKTAVFTLTTGAGTNSAEFAGEMPAAGSSFGIQYPITEPDLTAQEYTTDKTIPADKMLFTATSCTLGNNAFLEAQNAMLQLNLYGTDKTVGKIVFKNITAEPDESYTLTLPEGGVEISANSEEATPFYMVVLAGEYQFEVEVYDAAATPAMICSFATSEAKTFVAGNCLNMPAKEVADPYNGHDYVDLGLSVKWATYNLGATTPEGYGDYFAWGETETKTNYFNTYTYTDNPTTLLLDHDAAAANWKGAWRMPTLDEFEELRNTENCEWVWQENYNSTGVNGWLVTSKKNSNSIFLPAAGYYNNYSMTPGDIHDTNNQGRYWSSSIDEDNSNRASLLFFDSEDVDLDLNFRNWGLPVRPVCPIN